MARKYTQQPPELIEDLTKEALRLVGIKNVPSNQIALLIRLIISGIANYYFYEPDTLINLGFLQFCKSPDKDELFKVKLLRNGKEGVVNANTLWKYYKGELAQEKDFKEILEQFLSELIEYSQAQELDITTLTSKIQKK